MIKIALLDVDGIIIKLRSKYFSQKLVEDFGLQLDADAIVKFFQNEFILCETGKADLKEELKKQIKIWQYPGTVEDLMKIWFEGEQELVPEVVNFIKKLRSNGIKCFLATNNEKYRTDYLLNVVGIKNFVDGYFSSAIIGFMKPQNEFWQEVYSQLGNPTKDTVIVWDNKKEIVDSAKEFGFTSELYVDLAHFEKTMNELVK